MSGDRAAGALALALVLVLAGCGATGLYGGAGGDGEPTATLTPVDVPERLPGEESVLVPGLSTERVYDADLLRAAHRRAIAPRGFELHRSQTVYPAAAAPTVDDAAAPTTATPTAAPPTGSATPRGSATAVPGATTTPTVDPRTLGPNRTYNRILVRVRAAGPRRYGLTRIESSARAYRTAQRFARIDVWFARGVARNRLSDGQGVLRYWGRNRVDGEGPIADPTRARYAVADLAAFRFRVADRTTVDGRTRFRLVGTDLRPDRVDTPPLVTDPRDGRLYAVVDRRGVIRRYRLSYAATLDGRPVRVVKTHRVVDVGATALPRPAWLPAANRSVADRPRALSGGVP